LHKPFSAIFGTDKNVPKMAESLLHSFLVHNTTTLPFLVEKVHKFL